MRTDILAELDAARLRYGQLTADLARVNGDLTALRATARAGDGSVTATVDARGELVGLLIDPVLGSRLDPKALAARVLEAASRAAAETRERTRASVVGLLPEHLRGAVGTDGTIDMARLLPDPKAFHVRSER